MRKKFLLLGVSVCLAFVVTSCQSTQNAGEFSLDDLETATPIANGEIPPWMQEDGPQVAAGSRTPDYFANNSVTIPDETGGNIDGVVNTAKTPSDRQLGPAASTANRVSANGYKLYRYTFRKGDDLSRIAALSNTTVDDIMRLSSLTSPQVKPGTSIIVPFKAQKAESSRTESRRTVKSTRTSSSGKSRVSSSSSSRKSSSSSRKTETKLKPTVKHAKTVSYTAKKGDTVESIAKKFGSTSKAVRGATGLSSGARVKPGQTVRIPK